MSEMPPEILYLPNEEARAKHGGGSWAGLDISFRRRVNTLTIGIQGKSWEGFGELPSFQDLPNLQHIHLWGLGGLKTLPALPATLQTLDIQDCPDFLDLPDLPASLIYLIGKNLEALQGGNLPLRLGALIEVELTGCPNLAESWMLKLVEQSTRLESLDFSGCEQLTRLNLWPPGLKELRLNQCPRFQQFPDKVDWPGSLELLSLRGARLIEKLIPLPRNVDYVDLGGMEKLTELPKFPQNPDRPDLPRTLHLHGSGVLQPIASEHGEKADENVATTTREYFDDIAVSGEGQVARCKALILGNGTAGKTTLSKALIGNKAGETVSTHGVQFWDWKAYRNHLGEMVPLRPATERVDGESAQVHLWDFGGQEIYHSTHRLFVSKGSVFVVVWDPGQDGNESTMKGDVWRPLSYWFDFIDQTCDHFRPRVMLVCSKRNRSTPELEQRWRGEIGEAWAERVGRCHYVDSGAVDGEEGDLLELIFRLQKEMGKLIDAQGTVVPGYWQIAQGMAERWVSRLTRDFEFGNAVEAKRERGEPVTSAEEKRLAADREYGSAHQQMDMAAFRGHLDNEIQRKDGDFPVLRKNRKKKVFSLTDKRIRRTLQFLTHSGWAYWNPQFLEENVIIGQQWALDGIYTLLKREGPLYDHLVGTRGRIRLSALVEFEWHEPAFTKAEQGLLLQYAAACRICFKLKNAEESYWGEDVYAVFERLPEDGFDWQLEAPDAEGKPAPARLYRHHWQHFLTEMGERHGTAAEYARNAFRVETKEGHTIFIGLNLEKSGRKGRFLVQVRGEKAAEKVGELTEYLEKLTGGSELPKPPPTGESRKRRKVFVSYARNSKEETDLADPMLFLKERYANHPDIELLIDEERLEVGSSIPGYIEEIGKDDMAKVICIFSERYFKRPWCMWELKRVCDVCRKKNEGETFARWVVPVIHRCDNLKKDNTETRAAFWKNYEGDEIPKSYPGSTTKAAIDFSTLVYEVSDWMESINESIRWNPENPEAMAESFDRILM